MEDQSLFNSGQPKGGVTDDFRRFIMETISEVLVEGRAFDVQKRWLRRLGETEGVDSDALEKDLTDFFEAVQEWNQTKSQLGERMVRMLGKECYLTEQDIDGLLQGQQGGTDDEYISECIKEVCIKGDSISKYRTIIEKKYGIEYYQKCEGFVEEMKRSVDKKKFTNTSVTNLHYLARQIGVSDTTVDAIVKQFADKFEEEEARRGAEADSSIIIVDDIEYPYDTPTTDQLHQWRQKQAEICASKVRKMNYQAFTISDVMMREHPCLVYLILHSRSLSNDDEGKQNWFTLFLQMNEEQVDKLYDILYRETYNIGRIEKKYENKKAEIIKKYNMQ